MADQQGPAELTGPPATSWREAASVFGVFLGLGLTSFGGPIAHLGYFRRAFVERRAWLSEADYADLVALGQFLPGPASSQVGMGIGLHRAGVAGMIAAWVGFTLPSAVLMALFAAVQTGLVRAHAGWLVGLNAIAVAVVAHAVVGMAKTLTPDRPRIGIAVLAMVAILVSPVAWTQLVVIAAAGVVGWAWLKPEPTSEDAGLNISLRPWTGAACLGLFVLLLVGLPVLAALTGDPALRLADSFYRAGSLVFGGGHVVLPLLEAETVRAGLLDQHTFLAGYGAAQAVPGPLFTFSAFLGYAALQPPNGVLGAGIALVAIFLPGALLIAGALPFWQRLRRSEPTRAALMGVNAAVVGILAAALYTPVFTSGVRGPATMAIAAVAFVALHTWRVPVWAVVLLGALSGLLL